MGRQACVRKSVERLVGRTRDDVLDEQRELLGRGRVGVYLGTVPASGTGVRAVPAELMERLCRYIV